MLRMELGGLDGYDHGGLRRFVTTTNSKSEEMDSGGSAPSSTPSPQSPLQPLSTMACGGERKVFIALQMSHLMDLLLFSKEIDCRLSDKEQPKDTPSNSDASEPGGSSGIGACSGGGAPVDDIIIKTTADTTDEELIERLERIHRVGCFTCPMTMHEWTATTPKTVFALLRANITLLVHCEPTDPQLPGICQRLRRLSHFLVGTPSSTSSSGSTTSEAADRRSSADRGGGTEKDENLEDADLWVILLTMHLHNKLKELRMIAFSLCDNSDLIDGESDVLGSFEIEERLKAFQSPFCAVGAASSTIAASPDGKISTGKRKGSGRYSHRAFLHAPWEPYTAEESAAIAAARETTSG